jgi:ATP-dependent protease ClpP protease subunit
MAETPKLLLYGVCGDDFFGDGYTARSVAEFLADNADAEEIEIRINSSGGFVDEGTAIYNQLAGFPGKKRMVVDGVAASAASFIFMAGDERVMGTASMLMIHQPWQVTIGDANEHREQADVLEKFGRQYAKVYSAVTGRDEADVKRMLDDETWFEPEEAVELGFATELVSISQEKDGEDQVVACVERALAGVSLDFLNLRRPPARLMAARQKFHDLVPPKRRLLRGGRARLAEIGESFGALKKDAEGLAAPVAAAEVTMERSMAAKTGASAADVEQQETVQVPEESKETAPTAAVAQELENVRSEAKAEAVRAERARSSEIRRMVAAVKLPPSVADRLVEEGKTVAEAQAMVIDAIADQQAKAEPEIRGKVSVQGGQDASEKWLEGASQWVMIKAGMKGLIEKAENIRLDPGEFRGMSMVDLARDSLERNGVRTKGEDKRNIVAQAFTLRAGSRMGMNLPGNTTDDFTVLLEGVTQRTVLAGYNTLPDVWTTFCAIGSVPDFRAIARYRTGSFGALDRVNEAGEFKRKNIPDGEKGIISASTKGNIVAITRQAMINDDLGVFSTISRDLGRAAKLSIEVDVFALFALNSGLGPTLSDGKTLFHADHANIAGTGGAPSVTLFDAGRQQMAAHLDLSGNEYLDLRPAIWLGPTSIGGAARLLNNAQYNPDVSNKFQVPNVVAGLFSQVVDTPRLAGTRWYMLASPDIAPVFEVVFLDGVQEPFIDTQDTWTIDGTEIKVRLDYGVGAVDWRGAITNAGA